MEMVRILITLIPGGGVKGIDIASFSYGYKHVSLSTSPSGPPENGSTPHASPTCLKAHAAVEV